MRFTAIDFETANNFIGSICAVGLATVDEGHIIDKKYWLIKPHKDYRYFDPFNIFIHGITQDMVANADEFDSVYTKEIAPIMENTFMIAHNASFDMSALRHVLDLYRIEYPVVSYICTYKAAQRTWSGLENYKLDTLSKFLNYHFIHHNAQEDALACANLLLEIFKEKKSSNLDDLAKALGMRIGHLYATGYQPCSIGSKSCRISTSDITATTDAFDPDHDLYAMKVVFTGTLLSMPRREAMQRVVDAGGFVSDSLTEDTDYLVMGMQDYSKFTDGQESSKTKKAKALISKGKKIQIIDEKEFIRMIG